ncbi:MAG: hypothetical protein COB45_09835 [Gammaproteobacteria bacterium]|jgi:hypothetical protein|nr:MAG: hypothetical protein COB45_09835 [Gammaproteobacteria bacterium]PHR81807.1 MAG: hypothetical protein COA59_15325 [Colwellia sp.]
MKKIIIFIALILAIAGGAFWFITSDKLNELIAEQIEIQGEKFTEQLVTVKKVEMKLLSGAGTINGLIINNPSGYTTTPLFALNEITLDINIESLAGVREGKPILIDAIIINKPEALVEFNKTGGSNIQVILDAIDRNIPKSSASESSAGNETGPINSPKIRVKKFVLAGVALRVDLTELGNTTHKKILPDINLFNIGGEDGLPANELGGVMIKKALSAIWKEAKNSQKDVLKDQAKDKVKEKASELFNKWNKGN